MIATLIVGILIFISFVIISCVLVYIGDKVATLLLGENKK